MELSEIGRIVNNEWLKTFAMRPDMNLQMGAFVIMPNHFHAIIIIGENKYNSERGMDRGMDRGMERGNKCGMDRGNECGTGRSRDAMHCVSTATTTTTIETTKNNIKQKNKFGPQSKNLASIIRGFKTGVTTNTYKINADFAWQTRYYDHIIRNDKSYQCICNYILLNPKKWEDDKFHNNIINNKK